MKNKQTRCRSWKKGKQWLYSAGVLAVLVGGAVALPNIVSNITIHAQAAVTMPSGFDQIGSIGSAPVFETSGVQWTNIQAGVDALAKDANADYYVGSKSKDGKGQAIGWYDGQTQFQADGARESLGSLKAADPADLTLPNYNFINTAIMSGADGFTDADYYTFANSPGQAVAVHNVGQAFDVKAGKYIPIGIKVTIDDATYYDTNTASTPKDVFSDGYKLLVTARNDGRGNITLGYVVVMTGVAAVDNGGGGEGGGNGGSGDTYGGATTGIPESVKATVTYVNEENGQALPNSSLSVMKVADIDAGQSSNLQQVGVLGYIISNPSDIELKNNVLTAKSNATVNQDASTLDKNSFISVQTQNSFSLKFTDTLGNQNQGSIIESLFGSQSATAPEPVGYLQLDKTTVQYGDNLPNNLYDFNDLKFQVIDKDGKVVQTLTLDKDGKSPKSKGLPAGDYTLHEVSDKWSNTGQTERPDVKVTIKSGETTTVSGDKLANTAVQGQISITKKGVESGDAMWNENYTLAGNEFKITSLTDGKTYTLTTDAKGKAQTGKIPLGKYKVEETKASNGFVNTFKPVEVELTYKDNKTEVVFGDAKGTNQEVKGQNKIGKEDAVTGKDEDGKGNMKTAKYALHYNDVSTGSSAHKVGDPVNWKDIPNAKLLVGDKVSEATINGSVVKFGDNVVIDVDDENLEASVGNLAAGKYYWVEVDAGEGYTVDSVKHEFEIQKKDDKTPNIVTTDTASQEKLVNAKVVIRKQTENEGGSTNSGYNGVEFEAAPINGTKADPVKFTTGIDPVSGEDGYASALLAYGEWKITETKGIPGYDDIKPIYVRMTHDTKKDLLTVESSNYEDYHVLISTRTYNMTDDATGDNPNTDGLIIAGNVSSNNPVAPLSPMTYTDKETPEPSDEKPSIDIEKANGDKMPDAGNGNYSDKDNNVANDHDTKDIALEVKPDKETPLSFKITNNGTEDLTHIKFTDKTIQGKLDVKDIKWTFNGKALTLNDKGEFLTSDNQLLVIKPKEVIEIHGQLPAMGWSQYHGDEAEVTAQGVKSHENVGDKDNWYSKTPKPKPAIDTEKANDGIPEAGKGNDQDKDNNVKNDHDTEDTAANIEAGKTTEIDFSFTNVGNETLINLKPVDKTISGKVDVTKITYTYKGKTLTLDKDGYFALDGKRLELPVGDTISAKGTLPALEAGEVHGDEITITAMGKDSKIPVKDHDKWYGKTPKKSTPETPSKPNLTIVLPNTGTKVMAWLTGLGIVILGSVLGGTIWYKKKKKDDQ